MERYRKSDYNFFIDYDERVIYFNGISKMTFSVSKDEHLFFQQQLTNADSFEASYPTLFKLMLNGCFIKNSSLNELDYIRFLNRKSIFFDSMYRITINPTLECNFNCWYCYEDHPKGSMSEELQSRIVKHINDVANDKLVKGIALGWFGGEPLLYFSKVVKPISRQAKEICEKHDMPFINHATTNASLITTKMIKEFSDIGLRSFQITIDGDEKKHNKIRNENGKPSFTTIIDNIRNICEKIEDAHVTLRVNYDDTTLHSLMPVFNYFDSEIRGKIRVSFQRVWQTAKNVNQRGEKDRENSALLDEIATECIKMGYKVSFPTTIEPHFRRCHSDKYWHTEINYDGKLFKCTTDYSEDSQGELTEEGKLNWNKDVYSLIYGNATFENDKCTKCKLLPLCFGPCSRMLYKAQGIPLKNYCRIHSSDLDADKIIIKHYLNLNRELTVEK